MWSIKTIAIFMNPSSWLVWILRDVNLSLPERWNVKLPYPLCFLSLRWSKVCILEGCGIFFLRLLPPWKVLGSLSIVESCAWSFLEDCPMWLCCEDCEDTLLVLSIRVAQQNPGVLCVEDWSIGDWRIAVRSGWIDWIISDIYMLTNICSLIYCDCVLHFTSWSDL